MFNVLIRISVVAHTCHGHRCRSSPVPLSGTGKKKGDGRSGRLPALMGTRKFDYGQ